MSKTTTILISTFITNTMAAIGLAALNRSNVPDILKYPLAVLAPIVSSGIAAKATSCINGVADKLSNEENQSIVLTPELQNGKSIDDGFKLSSCMGSLVNNFVIDSTIGAITVGAPYLIAYGFEYGYNYFFGVPTADSPLLVAGVIAVTVGGLGGGVYGLADGINEILSDFIHYRSSDGSEISKEIINPTDALVDFVDATLYFSY